VDLLVEIGPVVDGSGSVVEDGEELVVEEVGAALEGGVPRGDVEVVFTICEEVGLLGATHLDLRGLRAKEALVLDGDLPGKVVTAAPSADRLEVRVHGREAHAGLRPEQGINAIRVAAEAIAAMRLGRLDEETTASVGTIEGGSAVNVVPGLVRVRAEARSHDEGKLRAQVAHMRGCFEAAAARHTVTVDGARHEARVEVEVTRQYSRMAVPADARLVGLLREIPSGSFPTHEAIFGLMQRSVPLETLVENPWFTWIEQIAYQQLLESVGGLVTDMADAPEDKLRQLKLDALQRVNGWWAFES
jgi:tripeptide aminopeptidase